MATGTFSPLSPPDGATLSRTTPATFFLDTTGADLASYLAQPCYWELDGVRLFNFSTSITLETFTTEYTWNRVQPGGVGTGWLYTLTPVQDWPEGDHSLKIFGYLGSVSHTQTRTFSTAAGYVDNHTETALDRLLGQFCDSTNLRALAASYVDRFQDLEDAGTRLINERGIGTATGARLDGIGSVFAVPRGGRTDEEYRLRLQAEIAVLSSHGSLEDLIGVLVLLLGLSDPPSIQIDEYFPKSIFLRVRDFIVTEDTDFIATTLRRAVSAGTFLQFIHTLTEADDEDLFRFSDTNGTSETSSSHGYSNGTFTGAS
jgi:hypothetical protein